LNLEVEFMEAVEGA